MFEKINTENAPAPLNGAPYSQAIKANGVLYVSGQLGLCPKTMKLAEGVEAQTQQSLDNIEAILTAAGIDMSHIVKCDVLLADINDFAKVNQIYGDKFRAATEVFPARACYQVAKLPSAAAIEICVTAVMEK